MGMNSEELASASVAFDLVARLVQCEPDQTWKSMRFRNLLLAGTTLRFEAVSNCFRRGAQMPRIPALRQTRRLAIGCGFSRERARRKHQSWNRFTPSQIP